MGVQSNMVRLLASTLAASLVGLVAGCGDSSGFETRYKVSGTVTYKGAPVAKGKISFSPVKGEGRGATGQIENGSYTLTSVEPGDGALPGSYLVSVDTREIDDAEVKKATAEFAKERNIDGLQMIPQEVQAKLMNKAKSTVPAKYMYPETTDLKVEVKAQTNKIDIELKD
jgi:hypothetical protein